MISLFLPAVILASGEAHASGFTWMQLLPGMHGDGNLGEQLGLTNPHEVVFIPTTWVVVPWGFSKIFTPGPWFTPTATGRPPAMPAAQSLTMSPKRLPQSSTSKLWGLRTSCIHSASTITSSCCTSG